MVVQCINQKPRVPEFEQASPSLPVGGRLYTVTSEMRNAREGRAVVYNAMYVVDLTDHACSDETKPVGQKQKL